MRPYTRVVFNYIKMKLISLRVKGFQFRGVQLFSRNLSLSVSKTANIFFEEKIISDGRTVIIVDKNANLVIGKNTYFNEAAMISCKCSITIGSGCKFGPNVKIFDNNHKFDATNGVSGAHSVGSIEIGENCWIGTNVVILKGTKIGKNSVIGAGCVISGEIPEKSIVTQGRDLSIQPMRE